MAYVNNETTPTSVEFQYYRSIGNHSATQQGDQVFVYALSSTGGGTWSVTTREASVNVDVSGGLTRSYSSDKLTIDGSGKQKLITQQDSAPSSASEGDLWLDTDENTNIITIDNSVSTTSTNPISNQAITNYVNGKTWNTYSATETRIGTWKNNKPLYRKVFEFGEVTGTEYIMSNVLSNVSEIVNISGSYKTGVQDRIPISVYYSASYNCATTVKLTNNTIGIGWNGWSKLFGGFVIVEYTKTTD